MTPGPWPLAPSTSDGRPTLLVAIRFYCLNFAVSSW
jgi:hypothetical protein